ncbi:hypothetical protein LTR36_009484 [Oleoguttula mirabilis]|uniref:LPXTG-motif cell wall anchor domain protein n=1 Tax=Oleoguttula mirabilis TaxID=1507867 RepID=A0AAV9JTG8_9PEZI|nr:hypothetical protein LTR36_009484 [Oleoguttula mirabilis]
MASEDAEDCYFFDAQASRDETLGGRVAGQTGYMTRMNSTRPTIATVQLNQPPPPLRLPALRPQTSTSTTRTRPRTSDGLSRLSSVRAEQRDSVREFVPAIPAIPARFLSISNTGERAPRRESTLSPTSTPNLSHSSSNGVNGTKRVSTAQHTEGSQAPDSARRTSLFATPYADKRTPAVPETLLNDGGGQDMARHSKGREADLFLELAQGDEVRRPGRGERVASHLSQVGKRRSLPADSMLTSAAERRPRTSGGIVGGRPASRLDGFPSDLSRHVDRYRGTPSRANFEQDDAVSVTGRSVSGRAQRFSTLADRSPMSPSRLGDRMRSPDLPSFGRRRPSFGTGQAHAQNVRQSHLSGKEPESQDESPAESSEPKRSLPDSASVDSDTADTVWDELDDLKSRIKKLEHTGKLPPASGAAVSGDSSERPRTATTAPTTIDYSPKHERKPEPEPQVNPATNTQGTVGGPNVASIHPLLHSTLAKAKPLLNATLYRSLEATASDALHLAAMTGSAGPQGTAFSAASIINGVTVSDRHVRRKADTMCRNLTDLCLALCEGKHEAPSSIASPITFEPVRSSPTIRYSRSNIGPGDAVSRMSNRPMSRLEARRTSILGLQSTSSRDNSPRGAGDDVSASEQEGTPSQSQNPPRELRRVSRPGSRLLSARMPRYDSISGDEDPTVRPPSRAMTDAGNMRNKLGGQRDYNSPGQDSSPSLRNSLAARRTNAGVHESNREMSRVASLSSDNGRRRWTKETTPPVLEEEGNGSDYQPLSQPKRRITSLGQFSARRSMEAPNRATSLSSRRHVIVE